EAFLQIFAVRAAAELERQQATEALERLNQDLEVRVEQRTEALRTSEANLSAIFNQAAVGINQATPEGQYLKVNQKLCDILGYTQEELLRKNFKEVCHPEDVCKGEEERQRLYAGVIEFFSIEKRCLHKNGSIVWINLTVSLVRQPSGEPDYSIGVIEDITDRKRTEEALRYSEEQFRTVFDHAPIAICLARVDNYRIFRVNAAHRQLLGYSDPELTEMSFTDFTHPEDIEQDVEQVKHMVSGEISGFQMEKRLIKKTGDVILTNMVVALIRGRDGCPLYSMAMIEDITKRRQTELEIIHNRDLREAIFNGSTDAIFLVDVNTHLTIDCNRRAIELFEATSKDELLNIEGNILQRNPFTRAELAVIAQEIAEKGVWSHEVEYFTRKGNLFWGNLAVKQISIAGQMMNLVRVTDISKRKQTEKLLNAQQDFLRRLIDTV
ncbi:MAG TPA: PAS domain S-box protein, partial [Allocoleopsis sp.]